MASINLLHLTFATLRSSLACGYLPTVVRVELSRRTVINMGTRKQDRILKKVQRAAQLKKELEAPNSATAAYPDIDVTTAAEDIAATLDDEPSPRKSRIKSFFTKCAPQYRSSPICTYLSSPAFAGRTYPEPNQLIDEEPIDTEPIDVEPIEADPIKAEVVDAEPEPLDPPVATSSGVESILVDVTSKAKQIDLIDSLAKIIVGAEKAIEVIAETDAVKTLTKSARRTSNRRFPS